MAEIDRKRTPRLHWQCRNRFPAAISAHSDRLGKCRRILRRSIWSNGEGCAPGRNNRGLARHEEHRIQSRGRGTEWWGNGGAIYYRKGPRRRPEVAGALLWGQGWERGRGCGARGDRGSDGDTRREGNGARPGYFLARSRSFELNVQRPTPNVQFRRSLNVKR